MSEIIYVSPQLYLISQKDWKSEASKKGFIPILKNDLASFQNNLNSIKNGILLTTSTKNDRSNHNTNGITSNVIGGKETGQLSDNNSTPSLYQPLKQFLPISLKQQLFTISLKGIPSTLLPKNIERFLKDLVLLAGGKEFVLECWSNVLFPGLDAQDLFIRFNKEQEDNFVKVIQCWKGLLKASQDDTEERLDVQLHYDSNTSKFIKDHAVKLESDAELLKLCDKFKELLSWLKEKSISDKKILNENDLENYDSESALQYKIDMNTLGDLPRSSLDQLCKDIIEFRTKVVRNENEKRVKESLEESRRRKQQMLKTFAQIKRTKDKNPTSLENQSMNEEDEAEDDVDLNTNEGDKTLDLTLENQRLQSLKEEADDRYRKLLNDLNSIIGPRLEILKSKIDSSKSYEEELLQQKSINLKTLIHNSEDSYYDHRRSFKEKEEYDDSINREKYGTEVPVPVSVSKSIRVKHDISSSQPSAATGSISGEQEGKPEETVDEVNIKFSFKKAIDKHVEASSEDESAHEVEKEAQQSLESNRLEEGVPAEQVLTFTDDELDERLAKLKESRAVDELVKEYLGVYEDDLVEYIFENIKEHKSKAMLVEDLKETFDEDSVAMVDVIWSRKELSS
ncbi:Snu71p NDAI_0B02390 [Naumovozyma dairenensis CBS 421]|uniref:U1 small nuclear ribonucleoprotein component SNU71 n=1 Tax=Naumovozyma dairenensis (strain ATCC 10597 / BCRC 20456 / CBS 421 / NBRC 0211 / NRRL Y-12639) TaxID=1071378 RepID=G0W663_NAUDC|nr:hypothetical protein NDAI_0B02390 [Naumovozyma dairenensis CBS 421]CCD23274.1 hypothetical protein NDAI_0B02390 [Naumovozyma dairenensis CBS 421]